MSSRAAALRPWLRLVFLVSVATALCLPLVASTPSAAAPDAPPNYDPLPDKFLFNIGALSSPPMRSPCCAAIAPDGTIYIANGELNHIQRFAADGAFLDVWKSYPDITNWSDGPTALAVAPDGSVYVAIYNHGFTIHHYAPDGDLLGQWGDSLFLSVVLAVGHDGTVLVADRTNQRVGRYSPTGQSLGAWGGPGAGPGQFTMIGDMAIAPDGSLLVTDRGNDRVQRLTVTGEFLGQWGGHGAEDGQFDGPNAVAVASDGTVYVADAVPTSGDWAPRVQRFTPDGQFLGRWDRPARGAIESHTTLDLSVAPDGTVLQVDGGANRVQRLSPSGALLGQIGSDPTTEGQLDAPQDVAVGPDGAVYVLDYSNSRVSRFAADGAYLGQWGRRGAGQGEFDSPMALSVAPDGKVYVLDRGNGRVQIFSPGGDYLSQWPDHDANAIDVAPDGSVYLAAQTTLLRLAPTGEILKPFGSPAYPCSLCFMPLGVAAAPDGSAYIFGNTSPPRIERYSADGERLDAWDYASQTGPASIDVAADGTVYVGSQGDGLLWRFSPDGEPLGHWRAQKPAMLYMQPPPALAIAPNGNLHMTNTETRLVEVYGAAYSAGWRNEYYANTAFIGRQYGIRTTDSVAFDWNAAPPDPALDRGHFSARFQRNLMLPSGVYTPTLDVQGGARLLIDDQVVIDASAAVTGTYTATVTLPDSGYHGLRMEYTARGEGAAVELSWQSGPKDEQVFLPALQQGMLPLPTPAAPKR